MNDIHIQHVRLRDLARFASKFLGNGDSSHAAPITLARAKAQAKNPHARDSDVALLAAFDGQRCVGYIGRLPGVLRTQQADKRVFWITTFFLEEGYRGLGLGKLLLKKLVDLSEDLVTSRVTEKAENAMASLGMKVFGELPYFQIRVERSHLSGPLFEALASRVCLGGWSNRFSRFLEMLEKAVAALEKRIFYASMSGLLEQLARERRFQTAEHIEESDFFPERWPSQPFFYRGPETIEWMLKNKWVFSKDDAKDEVPNYYFSGAKALFEYAPRRMFSERTGEYKGFLITCASTQKKRTQVRVLDNMLATDDEISAACAATFFHARAVRADRIEIPQKWGLFLQKNPVLKRSLKKQTRTYLYWPASEKSALERAKGQIALDYCDGDIAFT